MAFVDFVCPQSLPASGPLGLVLARGAPRPDLLLVAPRFRWFTRRIGSSTVLVFFLPKNSICHCRCLSGFRFSVRSPLRLPI
jgi:hypothetical protein